MSNNELPGEVQNNQVLAREIPKAEKLSMESLQKELLYADLISLGIVLFIILLSFFISVFIFREVGRYFIYILTGILLFFSFLAFAGWKEFYLKGFALREKDIVIQDGWLWRSCQIIPFVRIQHVVLNQGPIDRLFELAEIIIYTAGEESVHKVEGMTLARAMDIKEFILLKANL
ncbi:MAG: PH domain-containing protein [Saprospiraceae bacterium]|nr:PH domain-containing protein [Saprospiraceae bacterium]